MTFTTPDGTQLTTLEEVMQFFNQSRYKVFTTVSLSDNMHWEPVTPNTELGIFIYIAEELTETERNSFMEKLKEDAKKDLYDINLTVDLNLHAGNLLYYATLNDCDYQEGYDVILKQWLDLLQHLPTAYDCQNTDTCFVISNVTKEKLYSFSAADSHAYDCGTLSNKVLTKTEEHTWRNLDFEQRPSHLCIIGKLTSDEKAILVKWMQKIKPNVFISTFQFDLAWQLMLTRDGWKELPPEQ